jgi:hypothetical protein
MKTLTLIFATGALVAALAPAAGAKNALQCSLSAKHSVTHVRTTDPELPAGYQIQRNLQYFGTRQTAAPTSCKSLRSVKTSQAAADQAQVARNSF